LVIFIIEFAHSVLRGPVSNLAILPVALA